MDERQVGRPAITGRVTLERTELLREYDLFFLRQVLIAEYQEPMLEKGGMYLPPDRRI